MKVTDQWAKDYTGPGFDPVTRDLAADLIEARKERDDLVAEQSRAFSLLENAGIPHSRAKSVDNGIMVLDQRYSRQVFDLAAELAASRQTSSDWLRENAPGGWIDTLRNRVKAAEAIMHKLAVYDTFGIGPMARAWLKDSGRETRDEHGQLKCQHPKIASSVSGIGLPYCCLCGASVGTASKPIGQMCVFAHDSPCIAEAKPYTVVFKDGHRVEKYLCEEAAGECASTHSVADVIPCFDSADCVVKP